MKKNGILTLLFACIPGAGQMYQGYMKRGLSLITMFCLFIILDGCTDTSRVGLREVFRLHHRKVSHDGHNENQK